MEIANQPSPNNRRAPGSLYQAARGAALLHPAKSAFGLIGVGGTLGRQLIKSGRLRAVRIGRKLLVPQSAIEDFLREIGAA